MRINSLLSEAFLVMDFDAPKQALHLPKHEDFARRKRTSYTYLHTSFPRGAGLSKRSRSKICAEERSSALTIGGMDGDQHRTNESIMPNHCKSIRTCSERVRSTSTVVLSLRSPRNASSEPLASQAAAPADAILRASEIFLPQTSTRRS